MSTVTISYAEYRELLKNDEALRRLQAGGVDNWDWYGDSLYPEGELPFDEFCDQVDEKYKE